MLAWPQKHRMAVELLSLGISIVGEQVILHLFAVQIDQEGLLELKVLVEDVQVYAWVRFHIVLDLLVVELCFFLIELRFIRQKAPTSSFS